MPETRNVQTIADATFDAVNVQFYDFVRVDFPSPTGTKRYTNRPIGFTGDVDGTSQEWTAYNMTVGRLGQSRDSVLDVSWIEWADLDNVFSGYAETHNGLLFIGVSVWRGYFTPAPEMEDEVFQDAFVVYEGRIDECQTGTRFRASLVPHRQHLGKPVPALRFVASCQHEYGDAFCQRTPDGTFPTCPKTRDACSARTNLVHFGGFDLIPKPGTIFKWGSVIAQLPNTNNRFGVIGGDLPTYSVIPDDGRFRSS